jgi:hypothetical protein
VQAIEAALGKAHGPVVGTDNRGEIFNDFDMVVAISQKTINDQLKRLVAVGAIRPTLILAQTAKGGHYVYELLDQESAIPANSAYISARVIPQINIPANGTEITLVLEFMAGRAAFWLGGAGPLAQLTSFNVAGWSYGISVSLDLKAVVADDIARGRGISATIRDQLADFKSRMFDVSSLFLDFVSADLLRFDPATTRAGAQNEAAQQLALFMQFYFKNVSAQGNPFILGYSVTPTAAARLPADLASVPDLLRPVGTTFTLYHEPSDPNLSALNFALVTKGGHRTIPGTPPNLSTNLLLPDRADAKVAYASSCLTEPMLIRPVFKQIRESVYSAISGHISVGEGNDYDAARSKTPDGWRFNIANVGGGDDQYVNQFSVSLQNTPGELRLNFAGNVHVYKEVSKNAFFCTARAWARGDIAWSGTVSLGIVDGLLRVVNSQFRTDRNTHDSGTNSCADAFSWMGRIIGGVIDVFTGFGDNFYFSRLVANAFSVNVPGIGNVSVGLGALAGSARAVIVLPAGGVFDFHNPPAADGRGDLSVPLSYRA